MQHKGIIGFPFFYLFRIMILDFQFFFSPLPALQFSLKSWCRAYVLQLEFDLYDAWSCGELELDFDVAIQDVAGCLNFI
jgi:hypothetical protein